MIKIYDYNEISKKEIFDRTLTAADVAGTVSGIITDVQKRGDRALIDYAEKFDGAVLSSLAVSEEEIDEALAQVDPALIDIFRKAAENITRFHENQKRSSFVINENGYVCGQRVTPLDRAGIYVPGGTASYPSTVLMDSIPAKIAGCKEVIMVTPPGKDGKIAPVILAAAATAGIDRIFKTGGAQAIAALAYGTESIPKVDKIVGPGNAYVAEAKKQVFGQVSIDMIAGPSEILVIADAASDPACLAADLLSQAEHDRLATAVLVTDSRKLALAVRDEIDVQLPLLERKDIARASIDGRGMIIVAESLLAGIDIANELAPEHLELCVDSPFDYFDRIRHAGSVFLGRNCPEAFGDYMAGPNHTLPTSGTARFSSPLSVDDFVKKTQFTYFSREACEKIAPDVAAFARCEGLTAHAKSALIRLEEQK